MSYDLYLYRVPPGADPLSYAGERLEDEEEEEFDLGVADPLAESRKQALKESLIAHDRTLEPFAFDYPEIARLQNITLQEAKDRFRHIELNVPENGPGIQIELYDDQATLTVPYWHAAGRAEYVWNQIWGYLSVFQDGGLSTYDPQLDQILDLNRDKSAVLAQYAEGVTMTGTAIPEAAIKPKRPWWKLW